MAKKQSSKSRARRDTFTRKHAESERLGTAVRVDFVKGIRSLKRNIDAKELARAIASGKQERLMKATRFSVNPNNDFESLMRSLQRSSVSTAGTAAKEVSAPASLRYDARNPRVKRYIAERTGELITTTQDGTLQSVRRAVKRTFTHSITPDKAAQEIIGSIGLNERQAVALNNYRSALTMGANAVSEARADELADAYADRLLEQRAIMIARTETRFAQNAAQQDVWEEADKQGLLAPGAKRIWVVDGNPCVVCRPMDGIKVDIDEPWVITETNGKTRRVMNPTESHPNCFCIVSLDIGDA